MRALAPGGPYVALQLGLLTSSQFTDVSVNSGSFYYYVVTAVDLDGDESVLSAELAVPVGVSPWINEIHYDNSGADADEGVEIAGLAGIDLTGWQLVTYNGNGGGVTTTLALSGVLADDGSGFGFLFFPLASLQNGPAEGLALVDPGGVVVEFLSYEGVVAAVGGAANAMTSTDIGVSESSSTMLGDSLQLQGQGSQAVDFSWAAPGPHTRGAVNTGQELFKSVSAVPTLSHGALIGCVAAMLASGLWMALRPVRSRIRAKD